MASPRWLFVEISEEDRGLCLVDPECYVYNIKIDQDSHKTWQFSVRNVNTVGPNAFIIQKETQIIPGTIPHLCTPQGG